MQIEMLATLDGRTLCGPLLLTPRVFSDERGFFLESWNQRHFNELIGQSLTFVQDNHSCSVRGVLRGLHYQLPPYSQGKLVRCVAGSIFDVAVDIRHNSPTYGTWVSAELTATNYCQLWIPEGFAHGFLVLSENNEVLYKTTEFWYRNCERSLRWDDTDLSIAWPLQNVANESPLLSFRDKVAPRLAELPFLEIFGPEYGDA